MTNNNNAARIADALEAINEKLGGDDANHLETVADEANHLEAMVENMGYIIDAFDTLVKAVDRVAWEIGRK